MQDRVQVAGTSVAVAIGGQEQHVGSPAKRLDVTAGFACTGSV